MAHTIAAINLLNYLNYLKYNRNCEEGLALRLDGYCARMDRGYSTWDDILKYPCCRALREMEDNEPAPNWRGSAVVGLSFERRFNINREDEWCAMPPWLARSVRVSLGIYVFKQTFNIIHLLRVLSRSLLLVCVLPPFLILPSSFPTLSFSSSLTLSLQCGHRTFY